MAFSRARVGMAGVALAALVLVTGCQKRGSATLATRLAPAPENVSLRPPPPKGVVWLRVRSAQVPPRGPGGQHWDDVGAFPDPYVRLSVNGEVLLESPTVTDTIKPTFDGRGGNFALDPSDQLVVELRDADALRDLNMGRATVDPPGRTEIDLGVMEIDTGNRGRVVLEVEPAHALIGLGFDYKIWGGVVTVTEVWKHSPAGRGGMEPGDRVIKIRGRDVSAMTDKEVRSAFNAVGSEGIEVVVKHKSGTTATIPISNGPIYPLYDEYGPID